MKRPSSRKHGRRYAVALLISVVSVTALHVPTTAQAQTDTKPYDGDLLRLTELLGAVHYLRAICGAEDGTKWRDQMQAIINAEGATALRRVRLTQRFNKGYRSYQRTYRTCTPSAETAVERFLREGAELAQTLGTRTR